MLARAYFGPLNEKWEGLKERRIGEQVAGATLISFLLFMGLWPAPFVDRISDTVTAIQAIG